MATLCELRRASLTLLNRRRAFWAALHIQRAGDVHLPWLYDELYGRLQKPPDHVGPVVPEFYHLGTPSGQWVCACCHREVP